MWINKSLCICSPQSLGSSFRLLFFARVLLDLVFNGDLAHFPSQALNSDKKKCMLVEPFHDFD